MFEKVITKKSRQSLEILNQIGFLKNFYLVGGTGLALQFGHRKSIDFDFFSAKSFRPEILTNKISKYGKFSLKSKDENTLHGIFNGVRITLLYYPYPLLLPTSLFLKVKVADWRDIACMKLDAISSRGSKKDFIDLYFIFQKIESIKLFEIFAEKYKGINFNLIHILKSLCFFEEAKNQPMPEMIEKVSWNQVKRFFIQETQKLTKQILK